jgi:hypothetical protein
MFNNFPNLPFDDFAADVHEEKHPPFLPTLTSPWIQLRGPYVESVEAKEEMT